MFAKDEIYFMRKIQILIYSEMLTSVICLVCKLCNKIKSLFMGDILEQNNCLPKKISVSTIQAKFR